jgi:phosphopantetheine adenylyltransferase
MISFKQYIAESALPLDKIQVTKGRNEVVVVQGRFQPPTAGHLKAIKQAYSKYNKPIIIVAVKGGKSEVFFDTNYQKVLFKDMLTGIPHQVIETKTGFVGNFVDMLRKKNFEPIALFTGSDRKRTYSDQINRYKDQLNLDMKVEEITRTGADVSATKVRNALKSGDETEFKKNMDKSLWPRFDEMAKKLR